jgi:geranylgeranyl diphosphate synthase type II
MIFRCFGNQKPLAKQVGGDIIENKKTYLYLKAVAFSNQEEVKRLFAIQPNSTDKIERVKALLIVLGFKATQDAIQDFTFKAFKCWIK